MLVLRRQETLLRIDRGWFRARWHFSFDGTDLRDGIGDLRVLNEIWLEGNEPWPYHADQGVEEITYVAWGRLNYVDGRGNAGALDPGTIQRASFAPGQAYVTSNASVTVPVNFVQIWVDAAEPGLVASCDQRTFRATDRLGRLLPVLVPAVGFGGTDAPTSTTAVTVHQDLTVYSTILRPGEAVNHTFRAGFDGYLFLVRGDAHVATEEDAVEVDAGGAVESYDESWLDIRSRDDGAEALLVEVRAPISDRHSPGRRAP